MSLTFQIILIYVLIRSTFQQIPTPGPVRSSLKDLVIGGGAPNVPCNFYKEVDGMWQLVTSTVTSPTGGVNTLIHPDNFTSTNYKLVFDSEAYYSSRGFETMYPLLEVAFEKKDDEPHLIIVSISPYGYSAYRGRSRPV